MKWNLEQLIQTLDASHELHGDGDPSLLLHRLAFSDDHLRYELHIRPVDGSAQLSADPEQPIQACPMLEYGFNCSEIEVGPSAYGNGKAVRFYEHRHTRGGIRLTLTPRTDGTWYIWANTWQDPPDPK